MSQDDLQLPDDVEQLKALVAGQAVAIAERDASLSERESVLAQHAATITQHETVIDSLHETIEKQLRKLEGLHQQLARLLRKQYGPQKERIDHRPGSADAVYRRRAGVAGRGTSAGRDRFRFNGRWYWR